MLRILWLRDVFFYSRILFSLPVRALLYDVGRQNQPANVVLHALSVLRLTLPTKCTTTHILITYTPFFDCRRRAALEIMHASKYPPKRNGWLRALPSYIPTHNRHHGKDTHNIKIALSPLFSLGNKIAHTHTRARERR